jgi:Ca2+-binding RTX toxin-like protein
VTGGLGDDRVTMLVTAGNVDDADGGDENDTLAVSGLVGGTGIVIVDLSVSDQVTDIGGVADNILTQSNFEHLDASGLGVGGSVNVIGSAGNNTLIGSSGNDSLDGGAGHDDLAGGAGNDSLDGGIGNDRLDGGTGSDTLTGGAGNDTYVVNSASDTITEALNGGTDLVESTASITLGANVENLTLLGSASLNGTGNTLNNVLTGNSGNNVLSGLAGADTLNGGDGHDTLDGGNDADVLTGGTGNDQLNGGTGNDQLVGGAGNDTVVVGAGDGQDLIQESGGTDRLRFESGSGIDPLDLVISRQANDLRITVHGTSDQITIQNWYAGAASQIETIQAANGEVLLSTQVERLIQAMATFSATSGASWDQALDNPGLLPAVQNIIAANWQ